MLEDITEKARKLLSCAQDIPEFQSLESFIHWYVDNGMPMSFNFDSPVIHVEGFSASTLIQTGRYQAELYHIYNFSNIPDHAHPGINVFTFQMGGGKTGKKIGDALNTSSNWMANGWFAEEGKPHGGIELGNSSDGWVILSFQEWPEDIEPEAVSAWWVGPTEGPLHDALIEKYFPGAVIHPGYADITKTPRFTDLKIKGY